MKICRLFLSVHLIVLISVSSVLAAPQARHRIDLKFHPSTHQIEVEDQITLAPSPRNLPLWLNSKARIIDVRQGVNRLSHRFKDGRLQVTLPAGSYGRRSTLVIRYTMKLADALPPGAQHHEDPGYGISAAVGPSGAFLGGGSRWHPQQDVGRPVIDITVRMPQDWEAVSNGEMVSRVIEKGQRITRYRVRLNRPGLAVAAGPWNFQADNTGRVPVYTLFSDENQGVAPRYLQQAKEFLDEYSALLGPYPFKKFAIGENFFSGGYGYASWTLLGRQTIRYPFILTSTLPHEIVHNWFGNGVLVDYAQGNWSEGLTSYLSNYRYYEKQGKARAKAYREKILRDYASVVRQGLDYPLSRFHTRLTSQDRTIGYHKAMMVFHMLRKKVGDEVFWQGLKRVVRLRMNRKTSWNDLRLIFQRVSQKDLRPFFKQWVTQDGLPHLSLKAVTYEKIGDQWKVYGVLAQKPPFFSLQVPVVLTTRENTVTKKVLLRGDRARISFTTSSAPVRLAVDEQTDLLRALYPSEIPPTLNRLRTSKTLMVVVSQDISPQVVERAQLLLTGLHQATAPVTSELELTADHLRGRDVLFIGPPRNSQLLSPPPAPLRLFPSSFSLESNRYTDQQDVLFSVQPHSNSPDKVMALFWPQTPLAAESAARKIPRYLRYSYLAFRDGVNRVKGIWPVQDSPLMHHFDIESGR